MKALVRVPLNLYKHLEGQCVDASAEFRLLKSGVIDGEHVVIRCERDDAEKLCIWAEQCSSGASTRMSVAETE